MIKTKIEQDPRILEDEFYAKEFAFSYSSLNKLLYSPSLFYKDYILGMKEELLDKSLVEGRVIHALLLDQESFDEQFVITQEKLPSDNLRDVVEKVYAKYLEQMVYVKEMALGVEDQSSKTLLDFSEDILEILKEKSFYQNIKKDEDRIAKVINIDTEDYFEFLKLRNGKTVIDADTYGRCVDVVDKIKNHPCMKIMGMSVNDNLDHVYNELQVELDKSFAQFPFGLKGMIDNLFIDKDAKTIRVNDLKTTSKTIADFPETVKFYNYWMQAAIYMRLARSLMHNLKDEYKDYNLVFSFIVIDRYSQIYVFEVSEETMTNWEIDLQDKLKEAKYHYETRNYSLPYAFLKSQVKL
jgi:hypothetical protein